MGNAPMTKEAAVAILIAELADEDKRYIVSLPEDNLALLHHTLGRAIRNKFGLWDGNDKLMKDIGLVHPDDASGVIIKELWKQLKQKEIA